MTHFHAACSTLRHQPAFACFTEGAKLFHRVAHAAGPTLLALAVMPDHVHLIHRAPVQARLRAALSGYTRWRNRQHGDTGRLFAGIPDPSARRGGDKLLRDQRYVELNPCRARLVADPLAWPLSTWRDRMGLAWAPVRPPARDIARWYSYATRDDYVWADELPDRFGARDPHDVVAAVSSLTRRPTARLQQRGPERTLLVASLRWLTDLSAADIGDLTALTASSVRRVCPRSVPGLTLVERVAGDPRFPALDRAMPNARSYRRRQLRNARGPGTGWG